MQSVSKPELCEENLLINELIREYLQFNQYKYTDSVLVAGESNPCIDRKPLPFSWGEEDWQAAVLRVVPVREECHAHTRMQTSQSYATTAHVLTITAQNIIGPKYKYILAVCYRGLMQYYPPLRILWFVLP